MLSEDGGHDFFLFLRYIYTISAKTLIGGVRQEPLFWLLYKWSQDPPLWAFEFELLFASFITVMLREGVITS